jgi:S1-C subfamily serine protease
VTFNFVSDNDIIGGNSGSPVVDAQGRVVGAAFDGNIHSLGGAYGFDPRLNRMVTVTTASITEALDKVYNQPALVAELTGRPIPVAAAKPAAKPRPRPAAKKH